MTTRRIDRRDVLACLGVLALAVAMLQPSWGQGGSKIAVVFSPTGEDRKVHQALIGEISSAKKSVDVAMFMFTSRRLSKVLLAMAKKVRVRALVDERNAKKISISQHKALIEAGVATKYVRLPGKGIRAAKFHHKFCVVDQKTVVTGSFNWTVAADEINYENTLFIRDKSLAKKFTSEFERIWKNDSVTIKAKK